MKLLLSADWWLNIICSNFELWGTKKNHDEIKREVFLAYFERLSIDNVQYWCLPANGYSNQCILAVIASGGFNGRSTGRPPGASSISGARGWLVQR